MALDSEPIDTGLGEGEARPSSVMFRQRISVQQAWRAVLAALLIGLIVTGVQIIADLERENLRIDSLIEQVARISSGPASNAAFALDSELAGKVVNGLMAYRAIRTITLKAEFDRLLAQSSRPGTKVPFTWLSAYLFGSDRTHEIALEDPRGNEIGRLVLRVDAAVVGVDFLKRSGVAMASSLLHNLILAAVLTVLFHYHLTKPLLMMARRIGEIDPDLPGSDRLVVPRGHRDDELGRLVRSVETLRGRFAGALEERNREITEREQAEVSLHRSEQRLADAQRIARLGHWEWDIATDQLHWSRETYRIFGFEARGFESSVDGFRSLVHPDDLDSFQVNLKRTLEERRPYDIVHRVQRTDGEVRIVHQRGEIHYGGDGLPLRLSGTIQDVTELKRMEEEVRQLNTALEQRVEERTAELHATRDTLLRQQRLATLGELTGIVAHEIRSPLGAVSTSISVIREKAKGTSLGLERSLGRAERGIHRCDRIITELLDYVRARGLEPEILRLDDVIPEALREQSIPPGVAARYHAETPDIVVRMDREMLRRALVNVIDNACQAMAEREGAAGAGRLSIFGRKTAERIEIAVVDTGPGIPPEVLPKVLDPLYSTRSFGTGLGLPTVQRIMEDHDGGVEIESRVGEGTTVTLWLPADGNRK